MNDPNDFEKAGLKNLDILEESGFLKKNGYGRNTIWKVVATILGVLFIGCLGFIGYSIYDGKFKIDANPNILCEGSEFSCREQICICNETIICKPAEVNITISPNIFTGI